MLSRRECLDLELGLCFLGGDGVEGALVAAGGAALAEALFAAKCMLSEAAGFQRDEPFWTGCDTATAAAAFLRIDEWWRVFFHDANCLKCEFQLLPGASLDPGAGVIARAGGNEHSSRLFAGTAAGEAEGVGAGLGFHNPPRWGKSGRGVPYRILPTYYPLSELSYPAKGIFNPSVLDAGQGVVELLR